MAAPPDHHNVVREAFTRQALAYAANPGVADPARVARLVQAVQPTAQDRVLDVATGPGYVAIGFAALAREVVGVDLTPALLSLAEQRCLALGLTNLRFQQADAEHLPFADGEFDIVVCRLALHHFLQPMPMLREMARVCRVEGTVAVEDLITSEHLARGAYQDRFENLRDPSHTAAYPLSRMVQLFVGAKLEVEQVLMYRHLQVVEQWLANARTPVDDATEVRRLIAQDAEHDLSGTRPHQNAAGEWCFTQRHAIVVGRKLIHI